MQLQPTVRRRRTDRLGLDPSLLPGVELRGQFWSRDPSASFGVGLSDAMLALVGP